MAYVSLYFIFWETSTLSFIVTTKILVTVPTVDKIPWQKQKESLALVHSTRVQPVSVGKERHREPVAAGHTVPQPEKEDNECSCSANFLLFRSRGQAQDTALPTFTLGLPNPINSIKIIPPQCGQLLTSQMILDLFKLITVMNPYISTLWHPEPRTCPF